MKSKRGFTIIELLVVVTIIGVLATVVFVNVKRNIAKANYTKTYADMTAIADALKLYHAEENVWPKNNTEGSFWFLIGASGSIVTNGSTMKDFLTTKLGVTVNSDGTYTDSPVPPCNGARYGIQTGSYIAVVYYPAVDGPYPEGATNEQKATIGGTSWAVAQIGIDGGGFPEIGSKPDKSITCKEYAKSEFQ